MIMEIIRLFFTFAGNHAIITFFIVLLTAPFWFILALLPFVLVGEIIEALIVAFKKK